MIAMVNQAKPLVSAEVRAVEDAINFIAKQHDMTPMHVWAMLRNCDELVTVQFARLVSNFISEGK